MIDTHEVMHGWDANGNPVILYYVIEDLLTRIGELETLVSQLQEKT